MGENMKPSGIAWIGDIPESWDLSKLRFVTTLRTEQGLYSKNDKYIGLENISSYTGKYIETETEYETAIYDVCMRNDVLFSKLRPYLAKAMIAQDSFFCTGELAVIKKYSGDNRFLFYYLLSDGFLKMVDASTYGSKMPRASWEYIKNLQIPVLTDFEQTLIADFLDGQCEIIDDIATEIEKQIEILQKYKKSLITETVTKGLNKSVHMKDSGIEWIGDIPEHWEVKRIKHCCTIIGSGTTPESSNFEYYDGDYAWIQSGDLYGRDIIISTEKTITQLAANTYSTLKMYQADYVVVAMYGASVGNVAISKIDAYVNQACCVLAQDSRSDVRYLFYWLVHCKEDLIQQSFGGGQPNISQQKIRNEPMLSLPLDDQIQIANYLDEKCTKIDSIIVSKKEQLTKITQHKKSLIYEYVTGKKRVKGAHSNGN